jgi:hypothetical protein
MPRVPNLFAPAENESKDACEARVFGQQTTHDGIAVVWPE